ncbi:MAG TPA: VOC family protein [Dehalococcoidia bacterium]|jgi:catechol 2,3-dioxygenase-like lactoylglutathione lyase family enzyme
MVQDEGFEAIVELGISLPVGNVDRAIAFYCDYLGFDLVFDEEDPGQDRRVASVRYGNAMIDLILGERTERRQDARLYWFVEKLDDAIAHLEHGGGRVVRRLEYGVYCADPDGNSILVKQKDFDPEQAQELFF